eukprot:2784843-Alexandrium_andersonii.AAC.1
MLVTPPEQAAAGPDGPPLSAAAPLSSETAEAAILRGHREAAAPGGEALPSATVSLEGEDLPGGVAN